MSIHCLAVILTIWLPVWMIHMDHHGVLQLKCDSTTDASIINFTLSAFTVCSFYQQSAAYRLIAACSLFLAFLIAVNCKKYICMWDDTFVCVRNSNTKYNFTAFVSLITKISLKLGNECNFRCIWQNLVTDLFEWHQ
jgi:hypothetical protein